MFELGDKVIYAPFNFDEKGNRMPPYKTEVGIFKKMNPHTKDVAFVWYHSGCTTAATDTMYLSLGEREAHNLIHKGCIYCMDMDKKNYDKEN